MAKNNINIDELVQRFKDRDISCSDLKKRENKRFDLAKQARKDGFLATSQRDEQTAKQIRAIRKKVCKLK